MILPICSELRWLDGLKKIKSVHGATFTATAKKGDSAATVPYFEKLSKTSLATSWDHIGDKIGAYNKQWAERLKKVADDCMGANAEKLRANARAAVEAATAAKPTSDDMRYVSGKVPLTMFSEWLADFDPTLHRLEVPGQYSQDMDRPPAVDRHEMILSVDPELLVMASIRKPKRIKFYSSSGREVMFLVKGE